MPQIFKLTLAALTLVGVVTASSPVFAWDKQFWRDFNQQQQERQNTQALQDIAEELRQLRLQQQLSEERELDR